ncbi:MAG: hypothetical protein AB7T10_05840 [bacterium]
MKKVFGIIALFALVFAGCSIINPPVTDHSETVESYTGIQMWDFDQAGASGFWISDDSTGEGEALSVTGNGGTVDFWYNDRDYTEGAFFVSADGDSEVYYWGDDNTPKTTYFATADSADMTAPATMTATSIKVETGAWYWVKFDNGDYAKLHITSYTSPYDMVEFDYDYQTDGTEYFSTEE